MAFLRCVCDLSFSDALLQILHHPTYENFHVSQTTEVFDSLLLLDKFCVKTATRKIFKMLDSNFASFSGIFIIIAVTKIHIVVVKTFDRLFFKYI